MPDLLAKMCNGFTLTGKLSWDAPAFLRYHQRDGVAGHVAQVAAEAQRIAAQVGVDEEAAVSAGWLHDISLVMPSTAMVKAALHFALDLLPEEKQVPALIHGKLSGVFADKIFGVQDQAVLDAIGCHTTLRANATLLDKVLFVADKLSWDPQHAPYRPKLEEALDHSLDRAVSCFLEWMWQQRARLPVVHPWFRQAYENSWNKPPPI